MTHEDEEIIRYVLNVAESKEQDRAWEAFNRMLTECEQAQDLQKAVREYAQAYTEVIHFTMTYLEAAGDTSRPPDEWAALDQARTEKFAAMLKLAGVAMGESHK